MSPKSAKTAAPSAGYNADADEAERKAKFFMHLQTISAAKTKADEARASLNALKKEARADGLEIQDINFALKALEIQDDSIVANDLKRHLEIAKWLNLPVGHQMDFVETDRRTLEEKARHDGELAGLQHKGSEDCPFTDDNDRRTAWMEGWQTGRDRLAEQIKRVSETEEKQGAVILQAVKTGQGDDSPPPEEAA